MALVDAGHDSLLLAGVASKCTGAFAFPPVLGDIDESFRAYDTREVLHVISFAPVAPHTSLGLYFFSFPVYERYWFDFFTQQFSVKVGKNVFLLQALILILLLKVCVHFQSS